MDKFENSRQQLGGELEVPEDLFRRFMQVRQRLLNLGTNIQMDFGRPSSGFLDGCGKVLSTPDSKGLAAELKILIELAALVKEETPEIASEVDKWISQAESLIRLLEGVGDEESERDSLIAALREQKKSIEKLLMAIQGKLDVHTVNVLFKIGVNPALIIPAVKNLTKDQIERLQALVETAPDNLVKQAESILQEGPSP